MIYLATETNIFENISNAITVGAIIALLIKYGIPVLLAKLLIDYASKKFSYEFDYDRLAQKVADNIRYEEMSKRNGREIRNGINYDYLARRIAEEIKKSNET